MIYLEQKSTYRQNQDALASRR